ncbi:hypothetical protein BHE90_013552 [Fusarium euwallaceae]|uniref:Uncharacterized protein n=3 Tax=Fusarium solani species complex TaxID=232080 RepID=A0A3M2RUS5_9HYPO|nr:hypothetical protein CDV36_011478 [Fusarium kuroshium]RSL70371.1 hypothetical protein CEP51_012217 [Fusarium floridanum]RTE72033.1 hypothetical protein BHE90_013552 [Fusarium euwallaceae]
MLLCACLFCASAAPEGTQKAKPIPAGWVSHAASAKWKAALQGTYLERALAGSSRLFLPTQISGSFLRHLPALNLPKTSTASANRTLL